jgi:hypothetical protein
MKFHGCALTVVLLGTPLILAQTRPVPAGVRQGEAVQAQTENNIPPPAGPGSRVDTGQLRKEADELSRIAQSIPVDAASIEKGLLPKDMIEKLKQIEKLSKHLRSELGK